MKTTQEMINEKIWAGLNRPEITEDEADVIIFGIPFDGGVSFRTGASEAPQAIRSITYTIPPSNEYFEDMSMVKIKDIGDFSKKDRQSLFQDIENKVEELVRKDKFFAMIGGDHSVTIPVLRGIDNALDEEFGIIHIDTHFDLCDTLNDDKLSHGCTQRRALELKNISSADNIFFIGIRSAEPDELEFMKNNKLNLISAAEYEKLGTDQVVNQVVEVMGKYKKIYITIDIDVLDTFGTGTPQIGGISSRALLDLLRGLFDLNVIGFDVVEVAPKLDPSWSSVFIGRRLITECIGNHMRKQNVLVKHWR
ncbi:MAG: agmatinase [Clostridiales bacterium]|nr:agmatinase [Clostridiales bacterium]